MCSTEIPLPDLGNWSERGSSDESRRSLSHVWTSCDPMDCARLLCPWDSPGSTEAGCHFLLQGIFLTQGSNPRLWCFLHWQAGGFFTTVTLGKPIIEIYHYSKFSSIIWWFGICIYWEMITKISLVNIYQSPHTFFFPFDEKLEDLLS